MEAINNKSASGVPHLVGSTQTQQDLLKVALGVILKSTEQSNDYNI